MNILNEIEQKQFKNEHPIFKAGDKICVNFQIIDSNIRKKNYNFEGVVISFKNKGLNATCTIRKISFGEGVEKTFFINSPIVNSIKIIKPGSFKKSKLYYLRNKKI